MKYRAKSCFISSGFTLIELLAFIVLFICMWIVGGFIHGKIGGTLGWLLGGFFGLAIFLIVGFMLALLKELAVGGIPHLPKCREGTCRGPGIFFGSCGDYKSQKLGEAYIYVCKHGDRYDRHGKRFVIVNEDGIETPYLIWRPFRGWFPETEL